VLAAVMIIGFLCVGFSSEMFGFSGISLKIHRKKAQKAAWVLCWNTHIPLLIGVADNTSSGRNELFSRDWSKLMV
jgi:hypothetical protein